PFAIMIFDIDYFKRINDTFGHAAGDEALRAFATVLRNHTREVDVLSRLGGEEFGILMPETDLPEALHAAERLRQAVESVKVNFKTNQISMTTSIGIATLHESDEELHTLLSRADQSLYQAKAMGRNQVVASEF
ncbi:MAG: GGDEF domain-containing protein, partial [Cyanobacteria bacterium J06642_9]